MTTNNDTETVKVPQWPTREDELRAIALITDHKIGLHYAEKDCLLCWQLGRVPA